MNRIFANDMRALPVEPVSEATNGKMPHPHLPKKITLFTYMLTQGGTDRVAAILASGYADAGFDVEILVLCGGGEAQPLLSDIGGPTVSVRYLSRRSTWRTFDLLRLFPCIVRHLQSSPPDALISTANNTAWICAAARKLGALHETSLILKTTNPIIGSRHRGVIRRLRRWGYGFVFSKAAAVWTLSDAETALLKSAYPLAAGRIRTVVNPYVTEHMLAAKTSNAKPNVNPIVLGVGRLTKQKRFDLLIKAFALVKRPDAQLIILGDGADRGSLLKLIAELGVSDRVSLPGFVTDVAEQYHKADLFVLPSRYEGLPAVVLEAMAANCPVLSTDCFMAARQLLETAEGCAIIEEPDPAELARMIDERLGGKRPTSLRSIAISNSVESGIADHVRTLRETFEGARAKQA
jgi:glycosyltransferase involved in cell wall biosynthesis